ncbi:DUF6290 family protein [Romboutsia ilealis]|uniref:DUF6290 family protein n=1 Tax=Romboutsia ilealis TaxID=1115758 RepID=UPI0024956859|nr:DUF6290 family protein [Romboutsia ilealis]
MEDKLKTELVQIRLSKEEKERVKRYCKAEGYTMTSLFRKLIREEIRKNNQ